MSYLKLKLYQNILSRNSFILISENSYKLAFFLLQKARVISLSVVPEMECLSDAAIKKLKLNDLMPGTLLLVNPLQPTASGVYVNIGNGKHYSFRLLFEFDYATVFANYI